MNETHPYQRPCFHGECSDKGIAEPGFCKCKADAEEIARLRSLLHEAAEVMACLDPLIEGNAGTPLLVAWFRVEQARPVLAKIKAEIGDLHRQEQQEGPHGGGGGGWGPISPNTFEERRET